ncbi:uncharacterized protein LOC126560659 [Anopheles maculipalpis]|uniref:uncharacterized protein LOC126560659 n=1 Tax=Anopheles maculipalpis TaxID=1496333 RepID=UPI002158D559|nr:uncharacterized protein LOC126560659 [Anopheles maculipalpis]
MKGTLLTFILFSSIVLFIDAIIVHDDEVDYTSRERLYDTSQGQQRRELPTRDENPRANGLNFHEVDAFGDDFVDFGAQTGPYGAFTWHANFPVEEEQR